MTKINIPSKSEREAVALFNQYTPSEPTRKPARTIEEVKGRIADGTAVLDATKLATIRRVLQTNDLPVHQNLSPRERRDADWNFTIHKRSKRAQALAL